MQPLKDAAFRLRNGLGLRHALTNELQVVVIYPEKEKKERESKNKHGAFNHAHTFVNNSETNSRTIIILKIIINIRPYGRNNATHTSPGNPV